MSAAGAILAWLSSRQPWEHAATQRDLLRGAVENPSSPAGFLAGLAVAGLSTSLGCFVAGRRVCRLLGVLVLVGALYAVGVMIAFSQAHQVPARTLILAVIGCLFSLISSVTLVLVAPQWRGLSSKYSRPKPEHGAGHHHEPRSDDSFTRSGQESASDVDPWRALDEGIDPTE